MKNKTIFVSLALAAILALSACAKDAEQDQSPATPTAVVELNVQGMTCTGCEASIKMAVKKLDGVKKVEASFAEGSATVTVNPEKAQAQKIIEAINKIGYSASKKKS